MVLIFTVLMMKTLMTRAMDGWKDAHDVILDERVTGTESAMERARASRHYKPVPLPQDPPEDEDEEEIRGSGLEAYVAETMTGPQPPGNAIPSMGFEPPEKESGAENGEGRNE